MLKGAMQELRVGSPDRLATDIGPVIDAEAQRNLLAHIDRMKGSAKDHFALELPAQLALEGTFVPPTVLEIESLEQLQHEVFGPVLHVVRYRRADLGNVVDAINATGYGLTLGIHSRIDETIDFITARAHIGNIYVNRNIVGAVVGVQPFGGEGKSGTGPKAGGPLYLKRLQHQAAPLLKHDRQADPGLVALQAWARANGHAGVAALGEQYAHVALTGVTLELPGPTGERNGLAFAPRGSVLCVAATVEGMLNQLAAALATGNRALVPMAGRDLIPGELPQQARDRVRFLKEEEVAEEQFQAALVETGANPHVRKQLAARPGAIIAIIDTEAKAAVPVWRLVAERAVCVNTTAAGGNASLMTLGL
jgi:RHH-type proline utilization regulon transcriptional repressor/proline dehydrogenase/delta 1-pyrroline-5-carboxylate dehydrogenase